MVGQLAADQRRKGRDAPGFRLGTGRVVASSSSVVPVRGRPPSPVGGRPLTMCSSRGSPVSGLAYAVRGPRPATGAGRSTGSARAPRRGRAADYEAMEVPAGTGGAAPRVCRAALVVRARRGRPHPPQKLTAGLLGADGGGPLRPGGL